MSEPLLTQISGIGSATAGVLASNSFASVQAVAQASEADLAKVPGFGPARAAAVIAAARTLLSGGESPESTATAPKADQETQKKKKKKKKKKDKKGKGKDKGKKRKKDKKHKKGKKKK